jgi:hypothetical protein
MTKEPPSIDMRAPSEPCSPERLVRSRPVGVDTGSPEGFRMSGIRRLQSFRTRVELGSRKMDGDMLDRPRLAP